MSLPGWIAVGLLGGVAAAARFAIDAAIHRRARGPFPLGIFAVNVGGAFALGLVAGATLHGEALVIVAGGGIGSFTTFSTWILDAHRLDRRVTPASPGSTSASPSSSVSPPSPSATGSAGRC